MPRGYIPSIAFFGDSITDGMVRFLGPECYRQIGGKLRVGVYARTGSSVKDWVENGWSTEIAKSFHPNLVVMLLGTNPEERDEYEYAGLMQRACNDAQAAGGARCLVVGPFAFDDSQRRNRALLASFPRRSAINGYDLAAGLPRAGEGNVHFTEVGYRGLAERLVRRIVPAAVAVRHPGRSMTGALVSVGAQGLFLLTAPGWLLPMLPIAPP